VTADGGPRKTVIHHGGTAEPIAQILPGSPRKKQPASDRALNSCWLVPKSLSKSFLVAL